MSAALHQAALLHARRMAEHRDISHQFPGEPELAARGAQAGAHFSRIAENVAEGPSILILHDALMRSPGHRANILNAEVDAVGIAVLARDGQLYAVEDFQTTVSAMTLEQQEAAVGFLLDAAGLDLLPGAEARRDLRPGLGLRRRRAARLYPPLHHRRPLASTRQAPSSPRHPARSPCRCRCLSLQPPDRLQRVHHRRRPLP